MIKTLRFFLAASIVFASSVISGAIITSVNISDIFLAVVSSSFLFRAIIPPNAETESHLRALVYASKRFSPFATPQGFACLIIAAAKSSSGSNSETSSNAAFVSLILL